MPKRHVPYVPKKVREGHIVVHNHVRPSGPHVGPGMSGFRTWPDDADEPFRVSCDGGWAPHLEQHYRVDLDAVRAAEERSS